MDMYLRNINLDISKCPTGVSTYLGVGLERFHYPSRLELEGSTTCDGRFVLERFQLLAFVLK